jgi:hypothetical protein
MNELEIFDRGLAHVSSISRPVPKSAIPKQSGLLAVFVPKSFKVRTGSTRRRSLTTALQIARCITSRVCAECHKDTQIKSFFFVLNTNQPGEDQTMLSDSPNLVASTWRKPVVLVAAVPSTN